MKRRGILILLACAYLVALIASHLTTSDDSGLPLPDGEQQIRIPTPFRSGSTDSSTIRLAYFEVGDPADPRPPIIVLHGSPGNAAGFTDRPGADEPSFVERLSPDGRRVFAIDLPGFGHSQRWIPDYSAQAAGRAVVSLMDQLGVARAHLVCWSNSGAVGLRMCQDAPGRVASLTLMAAVGAQRTEGSGSYFFEHAKYALGIPFVEILPELVPHFGILGPRSFRHTFIRSFLDTDQRPLEGIMRTTTVPTLILHGRNDFLISAWAAEYHHAIMPTSRLVMMDGMHFLPFLHAQETADEILSTATRHDTPGVPSLTDFDNRAPVTRLPGPAGALEHLGEHLRWWPWWVLVVILGLWALRMPETATLAAALFVASGDLDFGVALAGVLVGRLIRGPEMPGTNRTAIWWLATFIWSLLALGIGSILAGLIWKHGQVDGGWLVLVEFPVGVAVLRLIRHIWTLEGRARILAACTRLTNHEWWPAWVYYTPIVCAALGRAIRGRSPLAFTACNPGIENAGGFVGESKSAIMGKLPQDHPLVLKTVAIAPAENVNRTGARGGNRAESILSLIDSDPDLGGYPIIIKPDAGERARGVQLARGPEDIEAFLEAEPAAAVLQRYHPGPNECGIFWMRKTRADDDRPIGDRDGFISSITLKEFQYLEGDGRHSIRRLIERHPRYRCQMRVFFERFADRLDEVLPEGTRLLLSFTGNHVQGTRFVEGGHLLTPEFEAAINSLARSFTGGGLDYGRFDIRYESEAELKAGRGFAILEVNGTTSEPTNMYDPAHSLMFAQRLLLRHWSNAQRIGGERIDAGGRALSLWRFVRVVCFGRC